jgi:uncharacterized protein YecT (DUF1311 family)
MIYQRSTTVAAAVALATFVGDLMRRRKFIAELGGAAAVTFVLCAGSTFAKNSEDRLDTPTYKKCMEGSGGVTVAMRECIADEQVLQDKMLNDTYKVVMGRMVNNAQRIRMRDAEREWLKRTKKKCDAAGAAVGNGTAGPLVIDDCWLSETETRTFYLRKLAR